MDRTRSRRRVISFSVLALFMAFTIGLTWTFWAAAINPPDDANRDQDITIGTAAPIDTVLTLSGDPADPSGALIPQGIYDLGQKQEGDVRQVSFTINVMWEEYLNPPTGLLVDEAGILSVSLVSIMNGATPIMNATTPMPGGYLTRNTAGVYEGEAPLFEVVFSVDSLEGNTFDIVSGTLVPVLVTVRMNIPLTEEMTNSIRTQTLAFTIGFSVAFPS